MLSYPIESQKGMFIGIFWSIFNLGGVVGASVSLGRNFHSTVCSLCLSSIPVVQEKSDAKRFLLSFPIIRPTPVSSIPTLTILMK